MKKFFIYWYRIIFGIYYKGKKSKMEIIYNSNFCVRKEWNKNVYFYLFCFYKIVFDEYLRVWYKSLFVGIGVEGMVWIGMWWR